MKAHQNILQALFVVIALTFSFGSFLQQPAIAVSPAVVYKIDAGQSQFTARTFSSGLFSAFGHNHTIAVREFTGEAQFVPDALNTASLQMTVKADSLTVTDKENTKAIPEVERNMREKVLDASKYPEIVFKSTEISVSKSAEGEYQAKITGDLSLDGVTRRVTINAQVTVSGDGLHARGAFSLRQTDYKISPPSAAGGTVKVKDEVKLSFNIVARRYS